MTNEDNKIKFCCDEWKRFIEKASIGCLDFHKDTMQFTLFGTFEGEDWNDEPFKINHCFSCGKKLDV